MMNPSIPPLPPNKPYRHPFNYPKYVKFFDPYAHVRVLSLPLKQMVKQKMQKLFICLVLHSKILCLTTVIITWDVATLALGSRPRQGLG
jgi:hypothetical protein